MLDHSVVLSQYVCSESREFWCRRQIGKAVLKSLVTQPGGEHSGQTMDSEWFRCELLGFGQGGEKVRALICDSGDPGNRATVKFVCESALCLALNEGDLPKREGVLTPATGLGEVLVQRLLRVGIGIELSSAHKD